jgi:hypothetical protein
LTIEINLEIFGTSSVFSTPFFFAEEICEGFDEEFPCFAVSTTWRMFPILFETENRRKFSF